MALNARGSRSCIDLVHLQRDDIGVRASRGQEQSRCHNYANQQYKAENHQSHESDPSMRSDCGFRKLRLSTMVPAAKAKPKQSDGPNCSGERALRLAMSQELFCLPRGSYVLAVFAPVFPPLLGPWPGLRRSGGFFVSRDVLLLDAGGCALAFLLCTAPGLA
jgi:hypothetical protein